MFEYGAKFATIHYLCAVIIGIDTVVYGIYILVYLFYENQKPYHQPLFVFIAKIADTPYDNRQYAPQFAAKRQRRYLRKVQYSNLRLFSQ